MININMGVLEMRHCFKTKQLPNPLVRIQDFFERDEICDNIAISPKFLDWGKISRIVSSRKQAEIYILKI